MHIRHRKELMHKERGDSTREKAKMHIRNSLRTILKGVYGATKLGRRSGRRTVRWNPRRWCRARCPFPSMPRQQRMSAAPFLHRPTRRRIQRPGEKPVKKEKAVIRKISPIDPNLLIRCSYHLPTLYSRC